MNLKELIEMVESAKLYAMECGIPFSEWDVKVVADRYNTTRTVDSVTPWDSTRRCSVIVIK